MRTIPCKSVTSVCALTIAMTLALCLCAPATGHAQVEAASGAQSLLIDPSVRASGMGRTSAAVFWGDGPNYWSNPALLAFHRGFRYEWGRTQLVPDLADDVFFTTKRVTAGYWGLGILIAGRPFTDVGRLRLDYGVSVATDVDGNPIGTFSSYEETQSFGGAANVFEFTQNALRAGGLEAPPLSRFGDVAVGWSEKKTHVFLAPADVTQDRQGAEGYTTTYDSGILFRLTPYDAIGYSGFFPSLDRMIRARVDVSHGRSTQSYNDARISYIDPDQSDPIARVHRKGWAAHLALDLPSGAHEALRSRGLGWLPAWITPLVQWGKAWDREVPMIRDETTGAHMSGTRVEKSGWEITIANIYSIRRGRIDDPDGTIHGKTSGWSVGLHLGNLMGLSYDRATIPQSVFLGPVHRKALSFYIDPIQTAAALRGIL